MNGRRAKAERKNGTRKRAARVMTPEQQHTWDTSVAKRTGQAVADALMARTPTDGVDSPALARAREKRARRLARNAAYR